MKRIILFSAILLLTAPVFAQPLRIAVAANLQPVIKELGTDFKNQTGISIEPISGSSGNLTAQVKNGAPYDVFLSADMAFPEALFAAGFATKRPVVYAQGKLIICSKQNIGFENWERLLLTDRIKKIAIAKPAIAPYGKAAKEALVSRGLFEDIRSKIVTAESISQVDTYITAGVADVGFTTQALVNDPLHKSMLYWKAVDPRLYSPIDQGMVILKRAAGNARAVKFYQYILSAAAKRIFEKYGYNVKR